MILSRFDSFGLVSAVQSWPSLWIYTAQLPQPHLNGHHYPSHPNTTERSFPDSRALFATISTTTFSSTESTNPSRADSSSTMHANTLVGRYIDPASLLLLYSWRRASRCTRMLWHGSTDTQNAIISMSSIPGHWLSIFRLLQPAASEACA